MEEEQTQIVSVTLKDIFRTALPSPGDLLPWYIPKCFWRSLVKTRQLAECETIALSRPTRTEHHCPAQPARDVLLQCALCLARLHNIRHVFVVSRNGGTVRRLLQLMENELHVLVLSDRVSTVRELLHANVALLRYGRAALAGDDDEPIASLPACHGVAGDEDILCGDEQHGLPYHTSRDKAKLYAVKLAKLFQSARMVLEQTRPEACRKGSQQHVLYLFRSFPRANFVNCFEIKRLR
uniref:Uncharacterized protein n=1 Tax=Anopheles farauti TaxID=69004 RepID=A0A182QKI8_9DIPT